MEEPAGAPRMAGPSRNLTEVRWSCLPGPGIGKRPEQRELATDDPDVAAARFGEVERLWDGGRLE